MTGVQTCALPISATSANILKQLGIGQDPEAIELSAVQKRFNLQDGAMIQKGQPLFPRIETKIET